MISAVIKNVCNYNNLLHKSAIKNVICLKTDTREKFEGITCIWLRRFKAS